jgi:AraC family transcriptional regulator
MIRNTFPDLQWLKQEAETSFASGKTDSGVALTKKGWPTVILNVAASNIHRDNIRGPLSLFTNFQGQSIVEADKRRVNVREGLFFITNHDQYYTLDIEKQRTETFNIHFGENFANNVYNTLVLPPEDVIDGKENPGVGKQISFYNRLHEKTDVVNQLLHEIRVGANDNLLYEEKLIQLMALLIASHYQDYQIKSRVPSVRRSTREEIMKRLLHSLDYLNEHYDKEIGLDELASVSCISKFHFLRLFKVAFNATPHHYLNQIRVKRAKSFLENKDTAITEIARQTGFKDSSSFSRMFFNQTGYYPSQYRTVL